MVRYAYGDWRWFALGQTGVFEGIAALSGDKSALGRKRLPGPLTPGTGAERAFDWEELRKHPERANHPLARLLLSLSPEELTRFQESNIQFVGHVEDKAYLYYPSVHCPKWFTINLPEAGRYTVEVIDTWAMTRTVVLEDVSGAVQVPLPHRENLAILARKTN